MTISAELTRLWESLEGTNKMRASLFNLILFTYKETRAKYIRTLAQKVVERFPSRILFITLDKASSSDALKASVSLLQGAKGEYDVVCDLIDIEASPQTEKRIPFLLLPYLLPDLPTYLLWAENPVAENPLSHQLEKLATRIIFDSETTDNLTEFSQAILRHKEQAGCDIADLNWARTENWRELLSTAFYTDERLEKLKKAKAIRITYNSFETQFFCHTKIQAIYLQGWLATQLGWALTAHERDRFSYGSLTIDLIAESHPSLAPGTIVSIDITTDDDHFAFSRSKEHPHQINMMVSDAQKCDIPSKYIFTKSLSGLSLVNEICHSGTSSHYLKLITFLSQVKPLC